MDNNTQAEPTREERMGQRILRLQDLNEMLIDEVVRTNRLRDNIVDQIGQQIRQLQQENMQLKQQLQGATQQRQQATFQQPSVPVISQAIPANGPQRYVKARDSQEELDFRASGP